MERKETFEEKDPQVSERLRRLPVPPISAAVEARLRASFRSRERRRAVRARTWFALGLAAALALVATALVARRGVRGPAPVEVAEPAVTAASLEGYEPVLRPRLEKEAKP
jgi:hypothetical protein